MVLAASTAHCPQWSGGPSPRRQSGMPATQYRSMLQQRGLVKLLAAPNARRRCRDRSRLASSSPDGAVGCELRACRRLPRWRANEMIQCLAYRRWADTEQGAFPPVHLRCTVSVPSCPCTNAADLRQTGVWAWALCCASPSLAFTPQYSHRVGVADTADVLRPSCVCGLVLPYSRV